MGSSNAEKAWEAFAEKNIDQFIPAPLVGSLKFSFNSGRASRDAEVAELTRLLAESRARFGDSEARRAELEAVISKAKWEVGRAGVPYVERTGLVERILNAAPSVVLEDRDREVAARALEDAAAVIPEQMRMDELGMHQVTYTHELPELPLVMLNGGTRFAERLVERAAATRKGDTNA